MPEIKNIRNNITKMKNTFGEFTGKLDMNKKRISELEIT